MIHINDVTIAVRGRVVLKNCSALLPTASITHLTGVNGSGKTTLIRAIAGIQKFSGSILFGTGSRAVNDGDATTAQPQGVARVRSTLYVCFDDAPVFPYLSGYENIRMLLGRPLRRVDLAAVAPALADHSLLRMPARKLSHGQRKRLHLVAALASGARYLILDEALNGVDAPSVAEVADALDSRAPDATVLMTGHHEDAYGGFTARRLELVDGQLIARGGVVGTAVINSNGGVRGETTGTRTDGASA